MHPQGVSLKYIELLSQCYEKYKSLSVVDKHLNPQPISWKKEVGCEISKQMKKNIKSSHLNENIKELHSTKLLLRRKRKILVSSSCKQKLHLHNFGREVRYFTETEDKKILDALKEFYGKTMMISTLCKELNRPYQRAFYNSRRFSDLFNKGHVKLKPKIHSMSSIGSFC